MMMKRALRAFRSSNVRFLLNTLDNSRSLRRCLSSRRPDSESETAVLAEAFNSEMEELFGAARMSWPADEPKSARGTVASGNPSTWQPRSIQGNSHRAYARNADDSGDHASDHLVSGLSDEEIAEMQQEMLRQQLQLQANAAAAEEGDGNDARRTTSEGQSEDRAGWSASAAGTGGAAVRAHGESGGVSVESRRDETGDVHVHVHLYGETKNAEGKAVAAPLHVHVHLHRYR